MNFSGFKEIRVDKYFVMPRLRMTIYQSYYHASCSYFIFFLFFYLSLMIVSHFVRCCSPPLTKRFIIHVCCRPFPLSSLMNPNLKGKQKKVQKIHNPTCFSYPVFWLNMLVGVTKMFKNYQSWPHERRRPAVPWWLTTSSAPIRQSRFNAINEDKSELLASHVHFYESYSCCYLPSRLEKSCTTAVYNKAFRWKLTNSCIAGRETLLQVSHICCQGRPLEGIARLEDLREGEWKSVRWRIAIHNGVKSLKFL